VSSVASVIDGGSLLLAVPVALAAGAVSFASPCVLPLVPGYLSYVTGMSAADAVAASGPARAIGAAETDAAETDAAGTAAAGSTRRKRWRTVAGAALFVLGFTAVFVSMGAAFGEIGTNLLVHQKTLEKVFGALMILMGLFFAGVFPERWGGLLQRDARIRYRPTVGLVGAPLLGVVFGVGWTPCLGPTLTAVQALAFTQSSAGRGAFLSAAYCIGLGLPFILTAVAFRRAMTAFGWIKRHYGAVTRIGGGMLAAVGAAMVSGLWDHAIHLMQGWVAGVSLPL
jgi:cytochrome c-type biogenesis protein